MLVGNAIDEARRASARCPVTAAKIDHFAPPASMSEAYPVRTQAIDCNSPFKS